MLCKQSVASERLCYLKERVPVKLDLEYLVGWLTSKRSAMDTHLGSGVLVLRCFSRKGLTSLNPPCLNNELQSYPPSFKIMSAVLTSPMVLRLWTMVEEDISLCRLILVEFVISCLLNQREFQYCCCHCCRRWCLTSQHHPWQSSLWCSPSASMNKLNHKRELK